MYLLRYHLENGRGRLDGRRCLCTCLKWIRPDLIFLEGQLHVLILFNIYKQRFEILLSNVSSSVDYVYQ